MKPPNAIVHMTLGGLRAGAVCGGLFGVGLIAFMGLGIVIFDATGGFDLEVLLGAGFIALMVLAIGAFVGGPVGLGVGFLSGFAIDWLVRRQSFPLSEADLTTLRQQTRFIVMILCGLGAWITFSVVFEGAAIFWILPASISCWAMLRVRRRYLDKLVAWEKPKNKVKQGF